MYQAGFKKIKKKNTFLLKENGRFQLSFWQGNVLKLWQTKLSPAEFRKPMAQHPTSFMIFQRL